MNYQGNAAVQPVYEKCKYLEIDGKISLNEIKYKVISSNPEINKQYKMSSEKNPELHRKLKKTAIRNVEKRKISCDKDENFPKQVKPSHYYICTIYHRNLQ